MTQQHRLTIRVGEEGPSRTLNLVKGRAKMLLLQLLYKPKWCPQWLQLGQQAQLAFQERLLCRCEHLCISIFGVLSSLVDHRAQLS